MADRPIGEDVSVAAGADELLRLATRSGGQRDGVGGAARAVAQDRGEVNVVVQRATLGAAGAG